MKVFEQPQCEGGTLAILHRNTDMPWELLENCPTADADDKALSYNEKNFFDVLSLDLLKKFPSIVSDVSNRKFSLMMVVFI